MDNEQSSSSGNGSPARRGGRRRRTPAALGVPAASGPAVAQIPASTLAPLMDALRACEQGDFGVRLPTTGSQPMVDDLAQAFNAAVSRIEELTRELIRVERVVGREGRMEERG